MAAALMPLHVAAYAECLSAPGMRALERLLARVTVTVDAQAARSGKGFVASWANVSILRLREVGLARGADVVMVLPRVGGVLCRLSGHGDVHLRWEIRRKRPLMVKASGGNDLTLGSVVGSRRHVRWGWRIRVGRVRGG